MFCPDDTARNSNLLPVNANGLVRLRSPASRGGFGSTLTPMSSVPPCFVDLALPFSICSKMSVSMSPRKIDRMAWRRLVGAEPMVVAGAGDAGAQQPLPLVDRTDHGRTEHQKLHVVVRCVARLSRLLPNSSDSDQLLCFPDR